MERQFPVGTPVIGDDLIGRGQEIKRLLDVVTNGQSVLFIAPRRLGKTSLALEILRRLKEKGYYTADVDLFMVLSKKEFAERLVNSTLANKKISNIVDKLKKGISHLIKNVQFKHVIEDFEFILDFASSSTDEDKLFENSLEFLEKFAEKNGRHLFVLLDEFGDITKLDGDEILKKMRAIIQRQRNVTYIFAGSQESVMKNIFGSRKSPFFRFAMMFEIGNLPILETRVYIKDKFTSLGFKISDNVAEEIISHTGCHPYYMQLLCQKIYINIKGEKKVVESEDVKKGLNLSLLSERQYFEELWERLRERKNYILVVRKIAEGGSPYDVAGIDRQLVYNIVVVLEKMGIIRKTGKARYNMIDPLFKMFVNNGF